MEIEKKYRFIKIDIDDQQDQGKYTDVAYLVDNLEFVNLVEKVREKFSLNYNFPIKDWHKTYFQVECGTLKGKEKDFNKEVEQIRNIFHLPPHYLPVIKASIIYGVVSDGDYSTAYLEEQDISLSNDPTHTPDIKYCIVIHSGTTDDDIETVIKDFREKVSINLHGPKNEKQEQYGYWRDVNMVKTFDSKSSIARLSEQYRLAMNRVTPLEIALRRLNISKQEYKKIKNVIKANKSGPNLDDCNKIKNQIDDERNTIKSEISRYKKFVNASNLIW